MKQNLPVSGGETCIRTSPEVGRKSVALFLSLIVFLMLVSLFVSAQDIPDKPEPPRLVNDFTKTLTQSQLFELETKLRNYNDSTSNQLVVIMVSDIGSYDVADYTYKIGEKWGVGQAGKNNGAVILIKPKIGNSRGHAYIATGYGLEGAIPDALAKRIVQNDMIPAFQQNDYYLGISNAVNTMMALASGEYSAEDYDKLHGNQAKGAWFVPIIIIILVIVMMKGSRTNSHMGSKSNLPFWAALLLASQAGRSHSGSWGNFSGGSGGFGGGGGGFGGFGGGSFGGGGAGGSW